MGDGFYGELRRRLSGKEELEKPCFPQQRWKNGSPIL